MCTQNSSRGGVVHVCTQNSSRGGVVHVCTQNSSRVEWYMCVHRRAVGVGSGTCVYTEQQ